jgi:hypothetical protein
MRHSAVSGRHERRSTDGHMILKAVQPRQKDRPDLLVCGAPLRNRIVDLLLTMGTAPRLPAGARLWYPIRHWSERQRSGGTRAQYVPNPRSPEIPPQVRLGMVARLQDGCSAN